MNEIITHQQNHSLSWARLLLEQPYRDGWQAFMLAFNGSIKVNEIAQGKFPQKEEQYSLSGLQRLSIAVLALSLWTPIINVIISCALRFILSKESIPLPAITLPSNPFGTNTELMNNASRELIQKFEAEGKRTPSETPNYVNGVVENLYNSCGRNHRRVLGIIQTMTSCLIFEKKGFENSNLTLQERAYLAYQLINAAEVSHFTHQLKDGKANAANMKRIAVPGDGNCFLWSCVVAQEIIKSDDPFEFLQTIPSANAIAANSALKQKQKDLRENLINLFLNKIKDSAYRVSFLTYASTEEDLKSILPSDDAILQKLFNNELPEEFDKVVNNYVRKIKQDRFWNGPLEAGLVAEIFQRPIVIFKREHGNYRYQTLAGDQFLETNEPIYLLHSGNHYEALVYTFSN